MDQKLVWLVVALGAGILLFLFITTQHPTYPGFSKNIPPPAFQLLFSQHRVGCESCEDEYLSELSLVREQVQLVKFEKVSYSFDDRNIVIWEDLTSEEQTQFKSAYNIGAVYSLASSHSCTGCELPVQSIFIPGNGIRIILGVNEGIPEIQPLLDLLRAKLAYFREKTGYSPTTQYSLTPELCQEKGGTFVNEVWKDGEYLGCGSAEDGFVKLNYLGVVESGSEVGFCCQYD